MKKLLFTAAIVGLLTSPALAFGPSASDANPPGALKYSTSGFNDAALAHSSAGNLNSAPVKLRSHQRGAR